MAIIKKPQTIRLEKVWRKGNPLAQQVGTEIDRATMKTVWRFLKKLRIKPPNDPTIPLLGLRKTKLKKTHIP